MHKGWSSVIAGHSRSKNGVASLAYEIYLIDAGIKSGHGG
jgi:hypothetical protein